MKIGKRLLALNLALLFVIVLLPLQAFAAEITPGTPVSYEKTASSEHETVTFNVPEDGFYRIKVSCPDHPGFSYVDEEASAAPMQLFSDVKMFEEGVFYAQAGETKSFQMQGTAAWEDFYGRSYDDAGTWNFDLQRVDTKPLTLGVSQDAGEWYFTFTPDADGMYWIGTESGYSSGTIYELPELDSIGSYGSNPCIRNLKAGVTYAIIYNYNGLNGKIVAKTLPRSGSFGDAGTLTWELSEDGVLTIGGSGVCSYLYNPPWRYMEEEVRTLVIGKNVQLGEALGRLPNLQTIRVEEGSENFTVVDGALYSADKTTLLYVTGSLRSFEIPDGVTRVCNYAFYPCPGMAELTVPGSVTSIGWSAFYGSVEDVYYLGTMREWKLANLHFGGEETVHFVNVSHDDQFYYDAYGDNYAVAGAVGRTESGLLSIPAAFNGKPVVAVGDKAFADSVDDVVIVPEGIQEIGKGAFNYASMLVIGLPASLKSISDGAFSSCYMLKDVYFAGTQEQWEKLTQDLDSSNEDLLNANVHFGEPCPQSIDTASLLRYSIVDGEAHVTGTMKPIWGDLIIPETYEGAPVTRIRDWAISLMNDDSTVTLPASLRQIDSMAFGGGPSRFEVAEDNPYFSAVDGLLCSKDGKTLVMCPVGRSGALTIPDGVENIAPGAIYDCDRLTEITIPDFVTGFGTPENPSVIWNREIEKIHLGSGVADLHAAFKVLHLPKLSSISVSESSPVYAIKDGDLVSKDGKTLALHPAMNPDAVTIPADVTTIGAYAYSNTQAPSALIGSQVTTLAYGAFYGAANLKSLSIPDSVTSLDEGILHHCRTVEQVALPEGLAKIPAASFYEANALKSLYIPASVTEIGFVAMNACWNDSAKKQLTIYFGGTEEQWKAITVEQRSYSGDSEEPEVTMRPVSDVLKGVTVICNHEHTLDAGVLIDGMGEMMRTCTECGKIVYELHQHDTELKNAKDATCTEAGYTGDKICKICGETVEQGSVIPATGHDTEVKNAKDATCTEAGYTGDKVCKTCGETVEQGEAISALGHDWSAWTETKPATETEEGEESRTCARCGETEKRPIDKLAPAITFNDVPADAYFAGPVAWAVEQGITQGTGEGTFSPDMTCTRSQIVTFLWRAAGEPEPETTENPFTDVSSDAYYFKAVLWAVEQNITQGTGGGKFSPDGECTRAQVVTFMYRAKGTPAVQTTDNPFADVADDAYYAKAVLWAVENNITQGTGNGKFSPDMTCTRGQIVTFLYRDMA